MPCRLKQQKNSKYKIPWWLKQLSRKAFYNKTLDKAYKIVRDLYNLNIEDITFRKIVYDAAYDALKNFKGNITYKHLETEYIKFLQTYQTLLNSNAVKPKLEDWNNYRNSSNYQIFLENLCRIKRFDHRLQASLDHALSYMIAKYQTKDLSETFEIWERRLKLDNIEKIWSKTWVWIVANTLVFTVADVLANTYEKRNNGDYNFFIPYNQYEMHTLKNWWQTDFSYAPKTWQTTTLITKELIIPLIGEVGSVALAEATRRSVVLSLVHLAKAISTISIAVSPARVASSILLTAAGILNKSVLAWLGWQITVEWTLDTEIQKVATAFFDKVRFLLTGEGNIHDVVKRKLLPHDILAGILAVYDLVLDGTTNPQRAASLNRILQSGNLKLINLIRRYINAAKELLTLRQIMQNKIETLKELNRMFSRIMPLQIDPKTLRLDETTKLWQVAKKFENFTENFLEIVQIVRLWRSLIWYWTWKTKQVEDISYFVPIAISYFYEWLNVLKQDESTAYSKYGSRIGKVIEEQTTTGHIKEGRPYGAYFFSGYNKYTDEDIYDEERQIKKYIINSYAFFEFYSYYINEYTRRITDITNWIEFTEYERKLSIADTFLDFLYMIASEKNVRTQNAFDFVEKVETAPNNIFYLKLNRATTFLDNMLRLHIRGRCVSTIKSTHAVKKAVILQTLHQALSDGKHYLHIKRRTAEVNYYALHESQMVNIPRLTRLFYFHEKRIALTKTTDEQNKQVLLVFTLEEQEEINFKGFYREKELLHITIKDIVEKPITYKRKKPFRRTPKIVCFV